MYSTLCQFVKNCLFFTACLYLVSCDEIKSDTSTKIQQDQQLATGSDPHTLMRGIYTTSFEFDPHFATTSEISAPLRDLFTGLMTFDTKGNVVPGIAQQWFTEDGIEWIFMLDEWAKWSNGEAVTAQDFVASWQRLINPQYNASLAPYLVYMDIKNASEIMEGHLPVAALGIEALGPNSLKISLNRPNFILPKMLTHSALLPTYHGKKPELNHKLITNGHYLLHSATEKTLYLQAVDSEPFFTYVQYQRILPTQAISYFDLIENPVENLQQDIIYMPRNCIYAYEFNLNDSKLKYKNIRKVLKTLIKTAYIHQHLGITTDSILPIEIQADTDTHWQPVIIEQLLNQEGIDPKNPLKLTLSFDNQGQHLSIANSIIRALGQSDLIQIQPQPLLWKDLLKQRYQRTFQLIRGGWCTDYNDPSEFVRHFHSQSPDNKMGYKNPEVDQLIEELISKNLSDTDRLYKVQQIDQILKDDIAIVPLFQYQRKIAVNSTIRGIDKTNRSEVIYSKDLSRMQPLEEQNESTERATAR